MLLYEDCALSPALTDGKSGTFEVSIKIGTPRLCAGLISSSYLNFVVKETNKVRHGDPSWNMMFAGDLIIAEESKEYVEIQFSRWQHTIEMI